MRIERAGRGHRLTCSLRIVRPIEQVFAFFADPGNLETITPDALRFRILTPPPIEMRRGLHIDYALRLRGLPMRWRSEISAWEPPHRFVDEQRKGPYRWWIHEHRFIEDDGATRVEDQVDYGVPGGRLAHALFVRRDLERIFTHRHETLRRLFP